MGKCNEDKEGKEKRKYRPASLVPRPTSGGCGGEGRSKFLFGAFLIAIVAFTAGVPGLAAMLLIATAVALCAACAKSAAQNLAAQDGLAYAKANAGGWARTGGGWACQGGGWARTGGGWACQGGGWARTGGGWA
ncbi:MAG: hypothetical protein ACOYUZ_01445 [Patescibacteria group bacterium]